MRTTNGPIARLGPAALSVGAGACLWASFAPLRLWPAAALGVALLVTALRGRSFRASFACGFAAGAVFFGLLCGWAGEAAGTWIARVGLGGVLALYTGVLAVVWQALLRAWGRSWRLAPALAIAWVAVEDIQGTWPEGGMPWGKLAFGQVEGPLVRLAPYGSTELVSFAVVALGASLAYVAHDVGARPRRALAVAAGSCAALVVIAAIPLGGPPSGKATAGFVQGNVSRDKSLTGYARALDVTERLAEQTRKIEGKGAQFVLWPESASDLNPETTPEARDVIEGATSRLGVPLVLGIQRYPEDYRYNEYTLWLPGKGLVARYTKQHPVPFGEYIPARGFFRLFTKAVDQVSTDMRPGRGAAVLDVPLPGRRVRIAAPICFEVAYTEIVSESVRRGATLITVPTNNASFGDSAESRQQFDMTRFRAVETRRTAIQISTMGVSGVVDADGTVREKTGMWRADARVVRVDLHTHLTPAVRWGGPIRLACALAAGATTALALWRTRRSPQQRLGLRKFGRRKCSLRKRGLQKFGRRHGLRRLDLRKLDPRKFGRQRFGLPSSSGNGALDSTEFEPGSAELTPSSNERAPDSAEFLHGSNERASGSNGLTLGSNERASGSNGLASDPKGNAPSSNERASGSKEPNCILSKSRTENVGSGNIRGKDNNKNKEER